MNKRIFKYTLETTDNQNITMPKGSEILCIQVQYGMPVLYALVDPNETDIERRFIEIFGTGHDIAYNMGIDRKYIGTYQLEGGQLVFHAFEYTGV